MHDLRPHTRVRLVGDPGRIGTLIDQTKPARPGQGLRRQVVFHDTTEWIPEDQLEPLPTKRESPIDLLRKGRLGRCADLCRTLTHVRLTGRLADVIYSMDVTHTDFYAYQFKPVLRYLQSPSNALLIADEVGLGKTIEAGLIWTELRSRFDVRRLLVICPAMLREKWQRELSRKMGVQAELVNADGLLKRLRDDESRLQGFALIGSLEGIRPTRGWEEEATSQPAAALARFLRACENEEPLVDLLIVDEAHYMRNPKTSTHKLGRLFRPVTEHLLLLTATPIHNYNRDLKSLLSLLDAEVFDRTDVLEQILEASRPLVQAREQLLSGNASVETLDAILASTESNPLLTDNRQLSAIRESLRDIDRLIDRHARAELAYRMELVNPLAYVITRTRKRDVKEWRVVREPLLEAVEMTPAEALFYDAVTEFVIKYAMGKAVHERFLLATPQRQMSSSMPATLRAWRQRRDNIDEAEAAAHEEAPKVELGPVIRGIIERIDGLGDFEELERIDSKYARVRGILRTFFSENPSEKVVLFSTFRETLNYLGERLSRDGIRNVVMHGASPLPKDSILEQFRNDPDVRVLLSSEVGSEGIDLQFCRVLINYDLPWNPMRIEQRIGRLDRLGQAAPKILIWNLIYADTIDERIYTRLYEKLDLCRHALGDFEEILGDKIRALTIDLLSGRLTAEQQSARIDQTAQALANIRHDQERLESDASNLLAYGDYILDQVRAARELDRRILADDLAQYVIEYLQTYCKGCSVKRREAEDTLYEISLSAAAKQGLEDFVREKRLSPTRLTRSASKPIPCRFESQTCTSDSMSFEIINQFHPLVRYVSAKIDELAEQLTPAVAVRLPRPLASESDLPSGNYLLAIARWSVTGLLSFEKLAYCAARIDEDAGAHFGNLEPEEAERLAALTIQRGADWFEATNLFDFDRLAQIADMKLFSELDRRFKEFVDDIQRRNEDRADLQKRNLQRHRDSQLQQLRETRSKHMIHGRIPLVKATEGRIEALNDRIDRKIQSIEDRRKITSRRDEIAVAIVRIM